MASLGKLTNSILSATNENTLALLNINVDFSLVRCDPSREYAPVGSALTSKRKHEAESGPIHATACKLGFLFHDILPSVPKLILAYGARTSEILANPDINPQGSTNDGPFRDFVGVDCTSIWAAATSGPASISVLLLACMLSRAWDAKMATSIWCELVEERRGQIQDQVNKNDIIHPHSIAAAKQNLGRSELAAWDASARSWLRRADMFMAFNHTQFRLVVDNLAIPYSSTGSTYEKVTASWTRSMDVVESLLGNHPHQANDRAVLLALSSWHLYPDLLVFRHEAKKISFKDKLFPCAGVLSLGLEFNGTSDNSTRWSLALSHLRHYGDPISVQSREDQSRVRIEGLWLVALGAIFRQWELLYADFDLAVDWFRDLHVVLSSEDDAVHHPQLSWIRHICSAAAALNAATRNAGIKLIRYGWRRGVKMLGSAVATIHSPFFGLCSPSIMRTLTQPTEVDCGLTYLRESASHLDLGVHQALLCYTGRLGCEGQYREWATIAPINPDLGSISAKHCTGNTASTEYKYVRWIHARHDKVVATVVRTSILEHRQRDIEQAGEVCYIVNEDDMPRRVDNMQRQTQKNSFQFCWSKPPPVFGQGNSIYLTSFGSLQQESSTGFHLLIEHAIDSNLRNSLFKTTMLTVADDGRVRRAMTATAPLDQGRDYLNYKYSAKRVVKYLIASLYAVGHPFSIPSRSRAYSKQLDLPKSSKIPRFSGSQPSFRGLKRKFPTGEETLHANSTGSSCETTYQTGWEDHRTGDMTGCFCLMTRAVNRSTKWLMSLRVLEIVDGLYEQLPGATVSLRIIEQDLLESKWLPGPMRRLLNNESAKDLLMEAAENPVAFYLDSMTRADSFACIAMFESGHFNIDPLQLCEVIALCSEDSIFVTGMLLSDPASSRRGTYIRRLVGNIGHSGMVLMVSPLEPRIRADEHNPMLVEHRPYDGRDADSFSGTSLHLSFTTWKMPLDWHNTGEIDQEFFLLESVVSVQDNGRWVADLDVVELETSCPDIVEEFCCTEDCRLAPGAAGKEVVSVDSWAELLDPPPCTGVFRAKRNWVARLAVSSILAQQGKGNSAVILGDERICWHCLRELYAVPEAHLPQLVIY